MTTQQTSTQPATFVNPTAVYVSKDKKYLLIILPGNKLIRKPVNYFKAILENIAFEEQAAAQNSEIGA